MSRLEETNSLRERMAKLAEFGIPIDTQEVSVLLDIAKSLAIIADKLSEVEHD